jgi:hypothetical protein
MTHVNIHVGDLVFYRVGGPQTSAGKAIIYKVDNENNFHICALLEELKVETLHPWGGDILRKDIKNVIEHWDADRIIQALRAGGEKTKFRWPEEEYEKLRQEMEKSSHKEKL